MPYTDSWYSRQYVVAMPSAQQIPQVANGETDAAVAELEAELLAAAAAVDAAERRAELAERQNAESHRLLVTLQVLPPPAARRPGLPLLWEGTRTPPLAGRGSVRLCMSAEGVELLRLSFHHQSS